MTTHLQVPIVEAPSGAALTATPSNRARTSSPPHVVRGETDGAAVDGATNTVAGEQVETRAPAPAPAPATISDDGTTLLNVHQGGFDVRVPILLDPPEYI